METIRENERCILGSILIDNEKIEQALLYIEPTDFTYVYNQMIYIEMVKNHNLNIKNDYITLTQNLSDTDDINFLNYLMEIADILPTAENIDSYIKVQKEYSNKRTLTSVFQNIMVDTTLNVDSIIDIVETNISKLTHISNTEVKSVKDYIEKHADKIADGFKDERKIETLYTLLDSKLKIKNSNMIVIGARPGVGKTAYTLNLCRNFVRQGYKTLFISLEMSKEELFDRLLSLEAAMEHDKITEMNLTAGDKVVLYKAAKRIQNYDLNVYASGNLSMENLINLAHRMKVNGELDVIAIDYIGLLDTNKGTASENERISYMSRKLKQLAMKLDIPVIVLTQLNRNMVDAHSGKMREPNLSDIRSSGALEQDANAVIFLHQESDTDYDDKFIDLIIAKNRSGKTGKIHMSFLSNTIKFIEKEYDNTTYVTVPEKEVQHEKTKN